MVVLSNKLYGVHGRKYIEANEANDSYRN